MKKLNQWRRVWAHKVRCKVSTHLLANQVTTLKRRFHIVCFFEPNPSGWASFFLYR